MVCGRGVDSVVVGGQLGIYIECIFGWIKFDFKERKMSGKVLSLYKVNY